MARVHLDGPPTTRRSPTTTRALVPRRVLLGALALVGLLGGAAGVVVAARGPDVRSPRVTETSVARVQSSTVRDSPAAARNVDAYRGLGAWVDAFDYSPPYSGANPPVRAATMEEMAAAGVRTVFLQTGRLDARSPDLLEDRWLLAELLLAAHQRNLRVVGWFLPKWGDGSADLDHLKAIADFSVLGQRFDGIAVDIEYNADKNPVEERSRRLVTLSAQLRAYVGRDVALGAIVMPPVLLEVVNTDYWPKFPYRELAPIYDVWLPMSYWSFRTTKSGYKDGYAYNAESTRRLRTNLGRPDALVHGIGGIGADDGVNDDPTPEEPHASINDLEPFLRSLRDTRSIGGSLYDWRTTEPAARTKLRDLFATFG